MNKCQNKCKRKHLDWAWAIHPRFSSQFQWKFAMKLQGFATFHPQHVHLLLINLTLHDLGPAANFRPRRMELRIHHEKKPWKMRSPWFHLENGWLVGGWATPLKNMSSSIGMISNPILMGKCQKWQPNHQPDENGKVHDCVVGASEKNFQSQLGRWNSLNFPICLLKNDDERFAQNVPNHQPDDQMKMCRFFAPELWRLTKRTNFPHETSRNTIVDAIYHVGKPDINESYGDSKHSARKNGDNWGGLNIGVSTSTYSLTLFEWRPFTASSVHLGPWHLFWSVGTNSASCLYIGPATYSQPLCFLRGGGRWQGPRGTMLALCCASIGIDRQGMGQCNCLMISTFVGWNCWCDKSFPHGHSSISLSKSSVSLSEFMLFGLDLLPDIWMAQY